MTHSITRRDLLATTAIGSALYIVDMLGPNGSWGPVLWDHEPPPVRLAADFEAAIGGKVHDIGLQLEASAEACFNFGIVLEKPELIVT